MNDWFAALYDVGGAVAGILIVAVLIYVLAIVIERRQYP